MTALALQPEDLQAALGLAICRNELGRHAAALEVIEPITGPSDAPGEAFAARGSALPGLNRPQEAVASYREALRREPGNPAAYVGLAQAWESLGRPDRAWAACLRALKLDPELAEARNQRDRLAAAATR